MFLLTDEDASYKSALTALDICKQEVGYINHRLASCDMEKISKEMEDSDLDLEHAYR